MSVDTVATAKPILERFSLAGRTALVTGAAQGIGRAYAHALAEAGANVAIVDIDLEGAETVAAELRAKGADSIAVRTDVTKAEQVEQMVAAVLQKWGKLTIAVNNAGIGQWIAAEEMAEADWDRMLSINLKGVFLGMQSEGRAMLKAGYGKIINTASISGSIVNRPQNQGHYNASKAAVIHLTRSFATEWAARGVRANCISPGYTRTSLVEGLLETPEGKKIEPEWMSYTPSHQWVQVTDLQGVVVFLASAASDAMTGSDVIVDGGYTAW